MINNNQSTVKIIRAPHKHAPTLSLSPFSVKRPQNRKKNAEATGPKPSARHRRDQIFPKMMGLSSITTVDSTDPHLRLSSLPLVDLRLLSQAELRSLSLCRDDAFDLRRIDDDVAPAIDRSIFNESAGSRRQTYSRRPSPPVAVAADDPELRENKQIAQSLCQLLSQQQNDLTLTLTSGERPPEAARRRERASTAAIVVYKNEYEVLNRSGAVVDVAALAEWEDPYGAELRRRTEGLETEEELLGFLNGLEGRWGSRRKKRKIVDAGDFGDELPVGWKLLLGLKRREGRASLNCRRYIRLVFLHFTCSGTFV